MPTDKGMYRPCWDLCLLLDSSAVGDAMLLLQAEAALVAGAGIVALGEGKRPAARLLALAEALRPRCREHGAMLLVEDRVDVALAAGADGVLLGPDGLPVAAARRLLPGLLLGVWAGSLVQGAAAERDGAGFLVVAAEAVPAGFTTPVEAVSIWRRPLIAAGEFTAQSAAGVIAAGAAGLLLRAAERSPADVQAQVRSLLDAVAAARRRGSAHARP